MFEAMDGQMAAWQACEAMGDAIAVFRWNRRNAGDPAWVGPRFLRLCDEDEAPTLIGMSRHLAGLDAAVQALVADPAQPTWNGPIDLHARRDALGHASAHAWLHALDEGLWVLRLVPNVQEELAVRRHLEDRESLLFTSRSVAVGEMATTLAHEINQPIGAVTNVLRGMQSRIAAAQGGELAALVEQLQMGVALALDQVSYASRIVTRIREYTASRKPRREAVDVHDMLAHSLCLLDWDLQRHGIAVSTHWDGLEDEPPMVVGDGVMLQQVVVNLIRNAMDAMAEAPGPRRLQVSTTRAAAGSTPTVEVAIRDSGSGVSGEQEGALFMPFVSTKPNGMGVGLNICRSFVELHQGRLWFQRNPDRGSTFCMALPLADAAAHAAVPRFWPAQQAA